MKYFFVIALNIFIIRGVAYSQPNILPRLSLWISADSGVIDSLGYVKNWKDISGKGNDAFQNNFSTRPSLIINGSKLLNGKPVVRFFNSRLVFSDFLNSSSGKVTVFAVYKINDLSGGSFGVSTLISIKNGLEFLPLGSSVLGFPSPFFR